MKMNLRTISLLLGFFLLLVALNPPCACASSQLLIPRNSIWKYNNLNQDLGTAWLDLNYNDSGWTNATAPLGDNVESGVQQITAYGGTVIDIGPTNSRYATIYFRKTVTITNASAYEGLTLRIMRDDAAFVYINGNFVTNVGCAGNFDPDPPTLPHTTYCCSGPGLVSGFDEITYFEYHVPPSYLANGSNIFAVEGRQGTASSSDLAFDMEVEGSIDTTAPMIANIDPAPNAVVLDLSYITVTFDSDVMGVDASDLLINSTPATNLTVVNPRQYTFYFPRPPTGSVQVTWATDHGITDTAPLHNPYAADAWSYTYNPNALVPANAFISEFMANNNTGIRDEDGMRSDWIEIHNGGDVATSLEGWFLTQRATNLTMWRFPAVVIQPRAYLIVWASGKDRRDPTKPLHTNFRLNHDGEYLALVDANTNIVSEFAPAFPPQQPDVSYGRDAIDPTIVGYFTTPTPGSQNSTAGPGFVSEPIFSLASGVYTNDSLTLTISNAQSATIRYTLDGSLPTNGSTVYAGPIMLTNNATIKARCFLSGTNLFPSPVRARNFVFVDASLRDFNSNLPLLILDSRSTIPNNSVSGAPGTPGNFVVIEPQGGRAYLRGPPQYVGLAGFELFGQDSLSMWGANAKHPLNIEIQDELRNDKEVSILGLPADADWKILATWEKSLLNNFLGFELFEQMGHYSCRRRYVEIFIHEGGGKLSAADYGGIRALTEKIEIAANRVDLKRMTTEMTTEPDISGGYIFKRDKSSQDDLNFSTSGFNGFAGQSVLIFHEPKPRELIGTSGGTNQQNYLKGYLNAMERSLYANNWLTASGTNHYSYYMDVDAFVDQFWIVEFTKQIDGYRLDAFWSKDRNGKMGPGPIWDWNLSFGNANYLDGGHFANWYWNQTTTDYPWAKRLITGSTVNTGIGDPDFCQKIADRWGALRTDVFSGTRVLARIDEIAALLSEGANRPAPLGDFTKPAYARLGVMQWPEPNGANSLEKWDIDYAHPLSYSAIIGQLKKWMNGRYSWIDSLFVLAPTFDQPEGLVSSGTTITLSGPVDATNYYTLDGSDPRASGGGIAPGAIRYSGPFTVTSNVLVVARARTANSASPTLMRPFQNTWSPPASRSYYTALPSLRITEIMYHPAPPPAGNTNDDDNFEYLEVQNIGPTPLNLNRFQISGGISFQFPNVVLGAGAYALIVKDLNAFQSRYGAGINVLGTYANKLGNDGDHLVLSGPSGEKILDFSYGDNWYPATDGQGFSLVINDPMNTVPSAWGLASSWHASGALGGSPGAADPEAPARPGILVNELLSYGDPALDAVELYNPTAHDVNLGGWFLSDDFRTPKKYVIPANTIISAGGYRVFTENEFNPGGTGFAFSDNGDEVYLFSGNGIDLSGYAHGFDFGAAEHGVTFGRYVDSEGDEHFVAQTSNTLGRANSGPSVGPIVISEINYHPSDLLANGGTGIENAADEYIELQNITGTAGSLYDGWRISGAVNYQFPDASVASGGFVLVVGFDPANSNDLAAFRQRMGVPETVAVYGPWSGALPNGAGTIELQKPRGGTVNGQPAYALVEQVGYRSAYPWPSGADGLGLTLQRVVTSSFGDDPTNWVAGAPSPGGPFVSDMPPAIQNQPGNTVLPVGTNFTFQVTATGPNLRYQWKFSGENLAGETNSTLTFSNIQLGGGGVFNVLVFNGGGYALGSNFLVRVGMAITAQPQNLLVPVGTSNSFAVQALSETAIRYQWYFNASLIASTNNPTATDATLTLTNVQDSQEGSYFCVLRDDFDVITSSPASLRVALKPAITRQPVSVTTVEGGSATFTIAASNAAPMSFRWRTNSFPFTKAIIINGPTNSSITFTNVPLSFSNYGISCVITNIGGQSPVSAPAKLYVLPDSDHDGLPDSWETATNADGTLMHPGFNPNDPSDGAADFDGDGMSNAAEYLAGTDYLDPQSYLKIEFLSNSVATLRFTAVSNRTYSIQFKDDLKAASWNNLADFLQGNNTRPESVTDPGPRTNRFYRLVVPIQR